MNIYILVMMIVKSTRFIIMSYILGAINPLLATLAMLSQSAISAIYAVLLFNEWLILLQIFAICIILVGLFIGKLDNTSLKSLVGKLVK